MNKEINKTDGREIVGRILDITSKREKLVSTTETMQARIDQMTRLLNSGSRWVDVKSVKNHSHKTYLVRRDHGDGTYGDPVIQVWYADMGGWNTVFGQIVPSKNPGKGSIQVWQ